MGNIMGDVYCVMSSLHKFLAAKNERYGNSAAEPLRVFSRAEADEQILVRMDDKLSRVRNSEKPRRNDVVDLLGYLTIYCAVQGWTSFDDMVD